MPRLLSTHPTPHGKIVIIGADSRGGAYVLRMRAGTFLKMSFGRFKNGKEIVVEPGEYVYVGSAQSESGSSCIARRLVRHATRHADHSSHPIREALLDIFVRSGLADNPLKPPVEKTLRWNIDHLLDVASVDLVGAIILRSPSFLEFDVAEIIENSPGSFIFEPGLGAGDHRGHTHLLRVDAGEKWWQHLTKRLRILVATASTRQIVRGSVTRRN